MSGRHVDPTALDTQMPLGQTSSLPVLPHLIHLVRQYDRPAYESLTIFGRAELAVDYAFKISVRKQHARRWDKRQCWSTLLMSAHANVIMLLNWSSTEISWIPSICVSRLTMSSRSTHDEMHAHVISMLNPCANSKLCSVIKQVLNSMPLLSRVHGFLPHVLRIQLLFQSLISPVVIANQYHDFAYLLCLSPWSWGILLFSQWKKEEGLAARCHLHPTVFYNLGTGGLNK